MAQVWDWSRAGAVAEEKEVGGCQLPSRRHRFPRRRLGPLPLSPILVRSTPIHAARPDRILFVVFSHPSSENATWLHNPRSTSCSSFSPGRSASPLAHLRPPRGPAPAPCVRRSGRLWRVPLAISVYRCVTAFIPEAAPPSSTVLIRTLPRTQPYCRRSLVLRPWCVLLWTLSCFC
jgi:hypothetical protein